jgi:hypothetical protein
MIGYHFLQENMRSGKGREKPWTLGETRTKGGKIALCRRGYHYSPTLWDALEYAPGPVACLVEVEPVENDDTKGVSRSRKLMAAVNIERELRLFAADCAEHVLHIYEKACPGDLRPRAAIHAARDYAEGRIDDAARDAAWDAASAAARDAAWDAANAAAWAAANAAANAAAWAAANAAANVGAWAAANAAANDTERVWQREQFETRLARIFDGVAVPE